MPKITATLAALVLAATVTVTGATAADASSKPTKADKAVMVRANHECTGEPDEIGYEDCVVGAFVLMRHRYIDERYYEADYSSLTVDFDGVPEPCVCVRLTKRSKKV